MSHDDLARIRGAFVDAARAALDAGFDALLLDMAHGYLLGSFLSPLTNHRDDQCGGDCERRLRYPLEVLDAVRAAWPDDHPLLVGINGSDRAHGGLTPEDAAGIARELHAHGADLLAVHAGQVMPGERHDYAPASLAQLSDVIRNESGVPTLATAYMDTTNTPNTLLASGRADLCLFQPPD
jgi:anthraniloyl-CoA monooxygenase